MTPELVLVRVMSLRFHCQRWEYAGRPFDVRMPLDTDGCTKQRTRCASVKVRHTPAPLDGAAPGLFRVCGIDTGREADTTAKDS